MNRYERMRLEDIKSDLQQFHNEHNVRDTWHEPDEQEVNAIITGTHLDNALGNNQSGVPAYSQEFIVHLTNEGHVELSINLADLLALAMNNIAAISRKVEIN